MRGQDEPPGAALIDPVSPASTVPLEARLGAEDARLVPAAVLAWGGAWTAVTFPDIAWFAAAVLGFLALGLLWSSRKLKLGGVLAVAAAIACLAVVSGASQQAARVPPWLEEAALDGRSVIATGVLTSLVDEATVLTSEEEAPGWGEQLAEPPRFELRLSSIEITGARKVVDASVLVFGTLREPADGPGGGAPIGSTVSVTGELAPREAGDSIAALVFASRPAEVATVPGGVLALTAELRERFVRSSAELPGPGAQLLPGLAVGDTRLVSPELDAAMKTSSLTHLTAVSGANCAIVVAAVLVFGRALGLRRGVRLACAWVALACFVALVTPEGSVIRASLMAAVVLVLETTSRRVSGLALLCLATLLVLVIDPWRARDYGFALSVLATLGLLVLTAPIADRLQRCLPHPIALLLAVPLAAQLACQSVLLLLASNLPLYGIPANLLAAPAAPLATIVGLLACLLLGVAPWLGQLLLWVAWIPAQWIGGIAEAVSGWPAASIPWPPGVLGAVLLLALTAGAVSLLFRWRAWLAVLLSIAVVIALGTVVGGHLRVRLSIPDGWRYAACDIGQGDATLVASHAGHVLIDTGAEPAALRACLEALGVRELRALVLSHFDLDHTGAATSLLDAGIPIGTLVVPDTAEARTEPLLPAFAAAGVPAVFAAAGDSWQIGDLTWTAVWPRRASDGGQSRAEGNDGSLTVLIEPGSTCLRSCLSMAALGDLGEEPQRKILGDHPRLEADVVKMAHHGSSDQEPRLYAQLRARVGLISVGEDNGYGHPTAAALDLLAAAGTVPLRTDELGTVLVAGEGGGAPHPSVSSVDTRPRRGERRASGRPVAARYD